MTSPAGTICCISTNDYIMNQGRSALNCIIMIEKMIWLERKGTYLKWEAAV